jgi:hypothetical protein
VVSETVLESDVVVAVNVVGVVVAVKVVLIVVAVSVSASTEGSPTFSTSHCVRMPLRRSSSFTCLPSMVAFMFSRICRSSLREVSLTCIAACSWMMET